MIRSFRNRRWSRFIHTNSTSVRVMRNFNSVRTSMKTIRQVCVIPQPQPDCRKVLSIRIEESSYTVWLLVLPIRWGYRSLTAFYQLFRCSMLMRGDFLLQRLGSVQRKYFLDHR